MKKIVFLVLIVTLLISYPSKGTEAEGAEEAAKRILMTHPDLKGIFGASEALSKGIINAVKAFDKVGEITIVGFDSGQELIAAIREGIVAGAVSQNPQAMGYKAVETAYRAYIGERLPAFIDTGFAWYDKSNIDTPEIRALLYE